jgi:hypothetical protein
MNGHQVALWAGISAFFGTVLAVGVIDIFTLSGLAEFATSLLVAVVTAGGVYAKQRLDDAKETKGVAGGDSQGVA